MARCPHCDYPLPDDRERVGARCPGCHDPLYEPPLRFSRRAREGEASCAHHVGMESVSVCARCNRHVCETCRTRWRGMIICAACADRAMATNEAAPPQVGMPVRQAWAGLMLCGGAWLTAAAALGLMWLSSGGSDFGVIVSFLALVLLAGAALLATTGIGQSMTALRVPGDVQPIALTGVVVGGLYVGLLMGIGVLMMWQS